MTDERTVDFFGNFFNYDILIAVRLFPIHGYVCNAECFEDGDARIQ